MPKEHVLVLQGVKIVYKWRDVGLSCW